MRVHLQSWLFVTFFLVINTAEYSFSRTATVHKIANANHSISLCKQCSSHLAKTILPTPKCVRTLITRPPRSFICNSSRV
uniref:Putative secreted protein n=1 Tax=Ixodes ricinus TaxID=34613 RepID=A0A6B0U600_IXORI